MKWLIIFISSLIFSIGESSQSEDGHCFADDKDCQNGQQSELSDTSKTDKFVPFRFSHRKRDHFHLRISEAIVNESVITDPFHKESFQR